MNGEKEKRAKQWEEKVIMWGRDRLRETKKKSEAKGKERVKIWGRDRD